MYFSFETIQTFVVGFIIIYAILWIKKPRLSKNEPPMVPYKIPIIGQVITIAGNEASYEIFNASDSFDLNEAIKDVLPMRHVLPTINGFGDVQHMAKMIREEITGKLSLYTGRIQEQLLIAINKEIGDCSIGEEISKHEDVINSFANVSKEFSKFLVIPPFLSFIHPKIHQQVVTLPIRLGWNPIRKHINTLKKYLKPVLEKRLIDKEILGDKYKPPLDVIEYYLNEPEYGTTVTVITDDYLNYTCEVLIHLIFISIHSTTRHISSALHDLAGRPELWDDLYEEQVKIDKECNGMLTIVHIDRMVKLDSFMRESLRTFGEVAGLMHRCIEDSYTFKNNTTIPKDRIAYIYFDDSHYNEVYGPEPRSFLPYYGLNNKKPATKINKNYLVFGAGKHACPGRFFVINEIKILMHKLILNYHIKTESGKLDEKKFAGPFVLPLNTGICLLKFTDDNLSIGNGITSNPTLSKFYVKIDKKQGIQNM
ncbi:2053_t:CDS:10 [Diversispora eburnea]|uniref:2053_t:CDS:1 n=1 Tax=Diversispora eburnea TaxID=1213867 RepID=A0A9N8W676_9GLOM|nr:2053_t:CDS:10 [Diversispora eburnea]